MSPRFALAVLLLAFARPAGAGIDVQVRGLGSDEESNTYAQIDLLDYAKRVDAAPKAEREDYDEAEVQRLFKLGEQDIRTALQPFGWYNPVVTSELRGAKPDWTAVYKVDAGPETDLSVVDVQFEGAGRDEPALADTVKRLRLRVGRRLKHNDYDEAKQTLLEAAYGLGYLDANLTRHELRVDIDNNDAQALLTLDTGVRYFFGDITIEQDGKLKDSLVRRYLTMRPNEPFDPAKLLSTQFALSDLDYFDSVQVDSQKDKADADKHIPIVIHTTPKARRVYKYGVGYGTDTGARALAGIDFRRLNEEGHKLTLQLRPSQKISTAIADYKIPIGTVPGENLDFIGEGLQQDFQGIQERLYSFGAGYTQLKGAWQRKDYLTYTNDAYTLPDEPHRTSTLLTPGISFSRTVANDPIFPRRGWFAFLDVHGASSVDQISDTSFVEALLKLRGVYPLGRKLRLLARVDEGAAVVSGFDNLPPSQRFFAGGDDSVRGYGYRSLGPKNSFGRVIGGKYLTTGSVELDYDVWRTYGVGVFTDAGGADDVPNVKLHIGVGAGLRYRAPFGAIAIDLAHPLDRDQSPVRLHIGVRVGI
ncbi:MAG: outer membrane protein assembly factor [Nevskia sp.]|nr:outer membrane protein assembly factor [Nevskia sp.]